MIYRNKILGDEQTEPVRIKSLPATEHDVSVEVDKLEQLIKAGHQASIELGRIRAVCKHQYFTDIPGMPYDTRQCAVCGDSMGYV